MHDFFEDEDALERDAVTGKTRNKMEVLNKKKVSKHELDELFCDY